jgi:SAM-dependent methyltransferase
MKFYYVPIVGAFYRARLMDAVRMLRKPVDALLDYGCGSGVFLPELSQWCRRLYACDVHAELESVRGLLRTERIDARVFRIDGAHLPLADGSLDAIVAMSVLEHVQDPSVLAREFHRVLKSGGVAIVGFPAKNLFTGLLFRLSYLTLTADLEEEHVSTDREVLDTLRAILHVQDTLQIPRWAPRPLRMYTTVRLIKPAVSARTQPPASAKSVPCVSA